MSERNIRVLSSWFLERKLIGDRIRLCIGVTLVGRQAGSATTASAIFIDSTFVSRKHAQIIVEKDDKIVLKDLNSQNGTYVNGTKIQNEETTLKGNDCIGIGVTDDSEPDLKHPIYKLIYSPLPKATPSNQEIGVQKEQSKEKILGGDNVKKEIHEVGKITSLPSKDYAILEEAASGSNTAAISIKNEVAANSVSRPHSTNLAEAETIITNEGTTPSVGTINKDKRASEMAAPLPASKMPSLFSGEIIILSDDEDDGIRPTIKEESKKAPTEKDSNSIEEVQLSGQNHSNQPDTQLNSLSSRDKTSTSRQLPQNSANDIPIHEPILPDVKREFVRSCSKNVVDIFGRADDIILESVKALNPLVYTNLNGKRVNKTLYDGDKIDLSSDNEDDDRNADQNVESFGQLVPVEESRNSNRDTNEIKNVEDRNKEKSPNLFENSLNSSNDFAEENNKTKEKAADSTTNRENEITTEDAGKVAEELAEFVDMDDDMMFSQILINDIKSEMMAGNNEEFAVEDAALSDNDEDQIPQIHIKEEPIDFDFLNPDVIPAKQYQKNDEIENDIWIISDDENYDEELEHKVSDWSTKLLSQKMNMSQAKPSRAICVNSETRQLAQMLLCRNYVLQMDAKQTSFSTKICKIVSKTHEIWTQISKDLGGFKSSSSLYAYVSCNRNGIRDLLNGKTNKSKADELPSLEKSNNDFTLDSTVNSFQSLETTEQDKSERVILSMSKHNFEQMVEEKIYKGRRVIKLKPRVWQKEISERVWNRTKLKFGFSFKNHYLRNGLTTGSAKGKCKCGRTIDILIEGAAACVKFECTLILKHGVCRKRPLREPFRSDIAKFLAEKTAERYRVECAKKLMSPGDVEPPTIPKSSVLWVAKNKILNSLYLDKDPVVAIYKLKKMGETNLKLAINGIGYDPFFVHYWTNQQITIFKKYSQSENACLKIDASGKFVSKIIKADKTSSQHIFMYLAVIPYPSGQCSVTQMLSEAHNTPMIQQWLLQWILAGIPPPKETVCVSSRALLTAIVRSFTGFKTVEKYCDYFLTGNLPDCYVRIDVNHFIHLYAKALQKEPLLIKKFYMGVIGKIIMSRNLNEAQKIITSALIVSNSETEGRCEEDNSEVTCSAHKQYLSALITGQPIFEEILEEVESDVEKKISDYDEKKLNDVSEDTPINRWTEWARNLNQEALKKLQKGLSPNAHFCPDFSRRLIRDLTHIPMWSCIYRDQFGFGRVPATSAAVEAEFNKIQNVIFKGELGKIRVDRFLESHIKILDGQGNLVQADMMDHPNNDLEETKEAVDLTDEDFSERTSIGEAKMEEDLTPMQKLDNAVHQQPILSKEHDNVKASKRKHEEIECADNSLMELHNYSGDVFDDNEHESSKSSELNSESNVESRGENWRGLGKKSKQPKFKENRYLDNPQHLLTAFNFPKNTKFPILKNGLYGVGQITKKEKIVGHKNKKLHTQCVTNTCAFDSILQIILFALSENVSLPEKLKETENKLFDLASYIFQHGLNGGEVYRKRTELLYEYLQYDEDRIVTVNTCTTLHCEIGIAGAVLHAFKSQPSCREISKCSNGCTNIVKSRASILVGYGDLFKKNFDEVYDLPNDDVDYDRHDEEKEDGEGLGHVSTSEDLDDFFNEALVDDVIATLAQKTGETKPVLKSVPDARLISTDNNSSNDFERSKKLTEHKQEKAESNEAYSKAASEKKLSDEQLDYDKGQEATTSNETLTHHEKNKSSDSKGSILNEKERKSKKERIKQVKRLHHPPSVIDAPNLPKHKGKHRGVSAETRTPATPTKDVRKKAIAVSAQIKDERYREELKKKWLDKPVDERRRENEKKRKIKESRKERLKELADKQASESTNNTLKRKHTPEREAAEIKKAKVKITATNRSALLAEDIESTKKPSSAYRIPKTKRPSTDSNKIKKDISTNATASTSNHTAAPCSTPTSNSTATFQLNKDSFGQEITKVDQQIISRRHSSNSNSSKSLSRSSSLDGKTAAETKVLNAPARRTNKISFASMQKNFIESRKNQELLENLASHRSCLIDVKHRNSDKEREKKKVRFNETPIVHYIERINGANKRVDCKDILPTPTCSDRGQVVRLTYAMVDKTPEIISQILGWSNEWLVNRNAKVDAASDILLPMPNQFSNYNHYKSIVIPLMKLEFISVLEREKNRIKTKTFTVNADQVTPFMDRFIIMARYGSSKISDTKCELVVLEWGRFTTFAYMSSKRMGVSTTTIVYEVLARDLQLDELRANCCNTITVRPMIDIVRVEFGAFNAIYQLEQSPLTKQILDPMELFKLKPFPKDNVQYCGFDDLNERQKDVLINIYRRAIEPTPNIALIQGPPGTGKSCVIANLVHQLLYGNEVRILDQKILICAQSNAAVDAIAEKLFDMSQKKRPENMFRLIRFGLLERISPKVRHATLPKIIERNQIRKLKSACSNLQLDNKIDIKEYLRNEIVQLEADVEHMKLNNIKGTVQEEQLLEKHRQIQLMRNIVNGVLRPEDERSLYNWHLMHANVVCTTLSSCVKLSQYVNYFDICIIDEATQCTEPWTLMPLKFGINTLVLVGDTQQLPATVLSKKASDFGLGTSLFTRIQHCIESVNLKGAANRANAGEKSSVSNSNDILFSLQTQYRMHPEICKWPNSYFYKNELIDDPKTYQLKTPLKPFSVLNLTYTQDNNCLRGQIVNELEAKFVARLVKTLDCYIPMKYNSYGVITPYAQQRGALEKAMRDAGYPNVMVNTIDSYQGMERDVIIISNARTTGIGFLANYQRLNVALTRPKKCLILCGNLKNLESVPAWRSLLASARGRKLYHELSADCMDDMHRNVIPKIKISKTTEATAVVTKAPKEIAAPATNQTKE